MTSVLFGEDLRISYPVSWAFGVTALAVSLGNVGRHWLVPLQRVHHILVSTTVGAVVGVVLLLVLGGVWAAVGAAIAVAITQTLIASVQVLTGGLALRDRPARSLVGRS